jgi:DNA-binding transcriptional ArsR family regulator
MYLFSNLKSVSKNEILINTTNLLLTMVGKDVFAKLVDEKKAAILRTLINSPQELYLKEIATKSSVSITSTFRILQELVALEILERREWKTSKVYSCKKNEKVEFLKDIFHEKYDGIEVFLNSIEPLPNIERVILHGARSKNKANVLIIGENIAPRPLENISEHIKSKGFELSFLVLTSEQYNQMLKMGLYKGDKKVLR